MNIEILLLSILYVLSFVAFIGAINSRGLTKMALSFFLAIVCLCTAIFHTAQFYVSRVDQKAGTGTPEEIQMTEQQAFEMAEQMETETRNQKILDQQAEEANKNENAEVQQYVNRASLIAGESLQLSKTIEEIKLTGFEYMTDNEYEALRNQAKNYLSTAMGLKNKLQNLNPVPAEIKTAHTRLKNGIENLVEAASNLERFFRAEDSREETLREKNFRENNQLAMNKLTQATNSLKP